MPTSSSLHFCLFVPALRQHRASDRLRARLLLHRVSRSSCSIARPLSTLTVPTPARLSWTSLPRDVYVLALDAEQVLTRPFLDVETHNTAFRPVFFRSGHHGLPLSIHPHPVLGGGTGPTQLLERSGRVGFCRRFVVTPVSSEGLPCLAAESTLRLPRLAKARVHTA